MSVTRAPLKPVALRPAAGADILAAAGHYRTDSGLGIALAFVDALDRAFYEIARGPGDGSPFYAQALDLPGLRVWPLRSFPHRVFFREAESAVDVWRILHGRRDVPEALREAALHG